MPVRRVLLVDDQAEVRRMLRAALESLPNPVEVHDAPSAEEALMMIATRPFDLLVCDVRLPGMSGLELQPRALAANPALKLILITGVNDPQLRRQAAAAGAQAFLTKPVDLAAFLDTVQSCLAQPVSETFNFSTPEAQKLKVLPAEAPPTLPEIAGALACGLLDARGRWLAVNGVWPLDLRSALAEAAPAIARLEHLAGASSDPLALYISGYNAGLLALGWENGHYLAVVFPPQVDLEAQARLLRRPADSGPVDERLQLLLDPAAGPHAPGEADAFWERLAGQDLKQPEGEHVLSYEQARRLGLAPGADSDGG